MKIKHGVWRKVLVVPNLGLVFKFPLPLVRVRTLKKQNKTYLESRGLSHFFCLVLAVIGFVKKAVAMNWREFIYYRKSLHPILQPTYFSFLGLVNIQRYGETILLDSESNHNSQFTFQMDILFHGTPLRLYSDPHHFKHSDNFSFRGDKLCMHDYGEVHVQKALDLFGDMLYQNYDPNRVVSFEEWCDNS